MGEFGEAPTGSASSATVFASWMRRTLIAIAVAVVGLGLATWHLLSQPSLANQEKNVIPACRADISDKLRDPGSAQFSDERVVKAHESGDGDLAYQAIGVVRAKNGLGGMAVSAYECTARYNTAYGKVIGSATLLESE